MEPTEKENDISLSKLIKQRDMELEIARIKERDAKYLKDEVIYYVWLDGNEEINSDFFKNKNHLNYKNVTQLTMNRIIYNLVPCNFIDLRILNIPHTDRHVTMNNDVILERLKGHSQTSTDTIDTGEFDIKIPTDEFYPLNLDLANLKIEMRLVGIDSTSNYYKLNNIFIEIYPLNRLKVFQTENSLTDTYFMSINMKLKTINTKY